MRQVRAVVREAAGQDSLIIHTLVSNNLRHRMLAEARSHGVDAMDLMGPLLDRLVIHLQLRPREKPGLFKQLAEARSREIEAVAFAFRHDDGQHVEELARAEIVLTGASRTMKTPIIRNPTPRWTTSGKRFFTPGVLAAITAGSKLMSRASRSRK